MLKYEKIIEYIIENIEQDVFKVKNPLPTIRELAKFFGCSKSTVMKAYDELQHQKIIYGVPQSGYFLVNKKRDTLRKEENINFSMATPDKRIFPYEDFQNCLSEASSKYKDILFRYNNTQGLEALRKNLISELKEYQVYSSIDNLVITNGAQQAIHILCNIEFGNNKKNILVEEPTYTGILKILKWKDIKPYTVKRDFSGLDMERLEYLFKTADIKFFYTTTRFHNPLGSSLDLKQRRKLCYLAKKYDVYIIEDDYLGELYMRNDIPLYYEDDSDHVIYIKSFSKIILPELRLAGVILPKNLINRFNEYKNNTDLGTSLLLQGALEIYISSGMFYVHKKKSRRIYKKKMNIVKEYSTRYDDKNLIWHIPSTGYFCCIDILNKVDMTWLINKINKKNIILGNMKDNFLSEKTNINTLKLCISALSEEEIKLGLSKVLEQIKFLR